MKLFIMYIDNIFEISKNLWKARDQQYLTILQNILGIPKETPSSVLWKIYLVESMSIIYKTA